MVKYAAGKWEIFISSMVLNVMEQYIQEDNKKHEAGGILLGEVDEGGTFYVTGISIPNIFDRSTRNSFDRDVKAAQIIVNHEFTNSGGQRIYLGEWHTHQQKKPQPSGQDKRMIRGQFENNTLNEPFVILVIQGIKGLYVALYDGKKLRAAAAVASKLKREELQGYLFNIM